MHYCLRKHTGRVNSALCELLTQNSQCCKWSLRHILAPARTYNSALIGVCPSCVTILEKVFRLNMKESENSLKSFDLNSKSPGGESDKAKCDRKITFWGGSGSPLCVKKNWQWECKLGFNALGPQWHYVTLKNWSVNFLERKKPTINSKCNRTGPAFQNTITYSDRVTLWPSVPHCQHQLTSRPIYPNWLWTASMKRSHQASTLRPACVIYTHVPRLRTATGLNVKGYCCSWHFPPLRWSNFPSKV